ncbi:MAG: B12-binding domain-containing radical SAM protein, partial [Candidatus Sungbacteria bacterium RIFCSPHIGHO2_02_FULL_49_12]
MNALLLYPEFPISFWSLKHALKFIGCKAALPPLGLITVAAMLPKSWNLRLIDMNVKKLTEDDLRWADCALISAMVVQRQSAEELIARCNSAKVPLIAGGPLFTEESEQFPEVDHLVLGEAEEIFTHFLADFEAGRAQHIYKAPGYSDIQTTPAPRWDLLDIRQYASMSVQFSRGCPYDCDFCDITVLFGRRPRVKTPKQVMAELDALWETGWCGNVFFVDDNFIGNKPYLKKTFLPALTEWQRSRKKPATFYTEATITLADDAELMSQMVAAGFNTVFVGIETPAEEGLRECNKLQNTRGDLMTSVSKLRKAGLAVQAGFIVGFDSDTPSIFERQRDFIQKSGIATAMVGMLQAPRGTRLYKRLLTEGRIKGLISGNNVDGTTNIVPKEMSLEVLAAGYQKLVRYLYTPKNYYRRVRIFLREYNPAPSKAWPDWQYFLALWRSFFYLGIFGKERFCYWQLIVWMLCRRPRLFHVGIKHAVYGYH